MTQIPLLDLAGWFDGDEADRRKLAGELDAHLQRLGFLVVVNHGVPRDVIDGCRERCREFFHLPAGDKQPVAMRRADRRADPCDSAFVSTAEQAKHDLAAASGRALSAETLSGEAYRGWVGPGLESNAATYGIDTPPDLKETFVFGPVDVVDETLRTSEPRWFSANIWPEHPDGFRDAAEAWWRAARALTDEVLDLCSLALRLPQSHLRDRSRATTAQVSLNWYGPRGTTEPEPDQFRIGPHTDFGTLTILDREPGAGGLQVLDEGGEWIDAPFVPGSLLVNTGDMLRRWTNDRWSSNQHRVLPPPASAPTEELISLIFFHEPDHDAVVEAFDTCVSETNPARYPAVIAHDYLASKMDALSVG